PSLSSTPMTHRRDFLTRTAGALGALAFAPALAARADAARALRDRLAAAPAGSGRADDEAFWAEVRGAFDLDPDVLNLDNGWTNPAPRAAVDELAARARALEALPAERLTAFWEGVTDTAVRAALAEVMGVPGEELALVRNATEALDTVLLGVP